MTKHRARRRLLAPLLALSLVLALAGCGDGDEDGSGDGAAGDRATTTTASGAQQGDEQAADPAVFCDRYFEVATAMGAGPEGGGDVEQLLDDAVAAAPDDIRASVETLAEETRGMMAAQEPGPPSQELMTANDEVAEWIAGECDGVATLEVTAVDYAFEDVADEVPAGRTVIRLDNTGQEWHEAVAFRVADDYEGDVMELIMQGEQAAMAQLTNVGAAFAAPGEDGWGALDLQEPGRYVLLCFIPVGTTEQAFEQMMATGEEPGGPPHLTQGMLHELQVE